MSSSQETTELLDVVGKILLRSFVMGYLLLLVWFGMLVFAPGVVHFVGKPFDLTPHDVNVIHYCALAFVKSCVLLFFLFPYVSIRLILRNRPR